MEYVSFFVGAGFADLSMELALERDLAFIGADAGTIDVGPYQLAGAGTIFAEELCRHDLRRALVAARAKGIPLVIGSCGGSGSDAGVDWFARLVTEIAEQEGLSFRVARIYSGWTGTSSKAGSPRVACTRCPVRRWTTPRTTSTAAPPSSQ